jgi:hypothetical protein
VECHREEISKLTKCDEIRLILRFLQHRCLLIPTEGC